MIRLSLYNGFDNTVKPVLVNPAQITYANNVVVTFTHHGLRGDLPIAPKSEKSITLISFPAGLGEEGSDCINVTETLDEIEALIRAQ